MPVRRRIEFNDHVWHALQQLCLEHGKGLQELVDEALRDLLRKRRRPVTLKDALRESLRMQRRFLSHCKRWAGAC